MAVPCSLLKRMANEYSPGFNAEVVFCFIQY